MPDGCLRMKKPRFSSAVSIVSAAGRMPLAFILKKSRTFRCNASSGTEGAELGFTIPSMPPEKHDVDFDPSGTIASFTEQMKSRWTNHTPVQICLNCVRVVYSFRRTDDSPLEMSVNYIHAKEKPNIAIGWCRRWHFIQVRPNLKCFLPVKSAPVKIKFRSRVGMRL